MRSKLNYPVSLCEIRTDYLIGPGTAQSSVTDSWEETLRSTYVQLRIRIDHSNHLTDRMACGREWWLHSSSGAEGRQGHSSQSYAQMRKRTVFIPEYDYSMRCGSNGVRPREPCREVEAESKTVRRIDILSPDVAELACSVWRLRVWDDGGEQAWASSA